MHAYGVRVTLCLRVECTSVYSNRVWIARFVVIKGVRQASVVDGSWQRPDLPHVELAVPWEMKQGCYVAVQGEGA